MNVAVVLDEWFVFGLGGAIFMSINKHKKMVKESNENQYRKKKMKGGKNDKNIL